MPEPTVHVSVIVPTHNRGALLRDHLDTVLNQTYDDYEVVYADDASTDDTPSILKEYAARYPDRLRHLRVDFGAPGPVRNAGVQAAQGELLLFTDDDVTVPPNWIADMLTQYRQHGRDALCGGFAPFSMETPTERYLHYRMQIPFGEKAEPTAVAPMMNFLIPKRVFEKAGGFLDAPLTAAEDWEFCLRLHAQGVSIVYDPAVCVAHRYQRDKDAATERICATARLGVHVQGLRKGNLTLYTGYSVLRFLASPLWIPRHYPPELYGMALRMETLFCITRVQAYLQCLRGQSLLPES